MEARSPIGRFALRLAIIYVLLVIPWPGLRQGYGALFRAGGNVLFSSFGSQRVVAFRPPRTEQAAWDTEVKFRKRGDPSGWTLELSSRGWGYVPTAAVLALVLASPMSWTRRWKALLIALGLVHAFIALRVALMLFYSFHLVSLVALTPFWSKATGLACEAFSASAVTSILIPVMIWLLVGFRTGQWADGNPNRTLPSCVPKQEAER